MATPECGPSDGPTRATPRPGTVFAAGPDNEGNMDNDLFSHPVEAENAAQKNEHTAAHSAEPVQNPVFSDQDK